MRAPLKSLRKCTVCGKQAEATIPVGHVCLTHAVEFYTLLVKEGARIYRPLGLEKEIAV